MSRMSLDTAIRLSAEVKGGGNIDRVKRSLQDLGKSAEVTKQQKTALRTATLAYARSNDQTLSGIRNSITALRGLQEQARLGSREFSRYGAEIQRLERNLRGIDEPARRASANLAGIGAAAARLVAAYAGIETVRFIFGSAAQIESQVRSLEVLTGSADRARQIVLELQQLGAVTPFTSAELIDTARRLQAFGVEANEVVDITRRLADVSGATGAELAGLATAYGQVQAKGRLQGEELLQFQERGVALQQVLRKEYGLSAEEFQKALEGGKISAEAVEFALKKLTDTGGKYANGAIAQSDTLNGRFSTLSDSVQVLAQTIGNSLAPVFKWALSQATAVVSEIQRLIDEANNAGGARDREAQFARNANAAVRAMGLNPFTQQGMMADMRQRNIEQQRADFNLRRQNERAAGAPPSPVGSAPPPLTGGTRAGGASGGGGMAAAAVAESMGAQIAKALQQALNLTPAQSAGIVGNLMRESGLNPRVNEGGAVGMPRGIGGYGLAQWTGSRQTDLVSFAGGGAAAGNLQTQLRFIVHELLGPESRALASLRRTTTPEEAAVVFDRDYERSGIKALPERKANARQVFGEIAGTGPGVGLDDFASTRRAEAQAAEDLKQKQAEANKRLEEFIEARTKSITELNKETELLGATTEIDRRRLEYAFERNEIIDKAKQQEADLLAIQEELKQLGIDQSIDEMKARIETEKNHALLILQKREEQEINDLIAERVRMMQALTLDVMSPSAYNPLEQQKADLDALLQKYPQVGAAAEAAADLATRGLTDMATGARSAKEVFADFLRGIADALIQTAKTMIAQYVAIGIARMFAGMGGGGGGFNPSAAGPFGGGGMSTGLSFTPGFGRAMGGPVNPGEIRPVGERGPELFVPYQAGTIIPAEATEAIAALNTAARGQLMVPYMGGGSGAAVGGQSGAAGLSVPFQGRGQQGGGSGLSVPFLKGADGMDGAAGGGGLNNPIRFESVLIGEVEYVTRSEAEEIGRRSEQRGAQRGAALAEKRARNNVSTRRSYR